ncbi:MAG: hypothetical protein HYY18_14885 [Planctomycetes bacterium]|nr:hypothetical protein [Planctomycetota bacterium]
MNRYVVLAFVAGVLAGALGVKLALDRRASEAGAAADGASTKAGSPDAESSKTGTASENPAAVRRENAELLAKVKDLEGKLAEAQRAAEGGGDKSKRDRAKKLRELAGAIVKAKKDADATGAPMKNDTWIGPLLVMAGDLAEELGVSVPEAIYSPDWFPELAMAVMELSPYPPTEEQRRRAEEILAAARAEWDTYAANREGMSNLEKGLALRELQVGMNSQLATMGSPEQSAWFGTLNLNPPAPPIAGVWLGAGPRANCRANVEKQWSKALALEPAQASSLGPVMDDYMRDYEAIQAEAARRKTAGEPYDDVTAKIQLMLSMQKRVGETVRLTDAQAKALREWNSVYDYQVKE